MMFKNNTMMWIMPVRRMSTAFAGKTTWFTWKHFNIDTVDPTQYQPIVDMSVKGQKKHHRHIFYNSVKALPTVDEKLYELMMHYKVRQPRYLIPSVPPTYNGIYFQRYITRTHLINQLPEKISLMDVDKEYNDIADIFKKTVASFYNNNFKISDETLISGKSDAELVNALVTQCFRKLAVRNDYILESTLQQKPRINAFWFHNGFNPKLGLLKENPLFQFQDFPAFTVRIRKPLNPILDRDDPLCATAEVPKYNYHPKVLGFTYDKKIFTSIPGFWVGDPCDNPFLLVKTMKSFSELTDRTQFYDLQKLTESVAITSSFGWLNASATYHGFDPYNDVTYPFVCQTIITDGRDWNFFLYQLNTIAFHADVDQGNRRNICWSSGKMRLFDTIEDGEIKEFNPEVVKVLLKLLLNAPLPQENVHFKPYLGEDTRTEEEIQVHKDFYRYQTSQRPKITAHRHEVPTWQRIYLPKYNKLARPMPYTRLQ